MEVVDPVERAAIWLTMDCGNYGSPLSVLLPEMRLQWDVIVGELQSDAGPPGAGNERSPAKNDPELIGPKPSPRRIIEALRRGLERGLFRAEYSDGSRAPSPGVDDATWTRIAAEYERGVRDPDLVQQILDLDDVWIVLTPEGRSHA